ncbi:MAG: hypothetical protein AAF547_19730, partial [Actinomycetota bacterium]
PALVARLEDPDPNVRAAAAVQMVKEAVNATANALHRASSFADYDQSALSRTFTESIEARERFNSD